MLNILYKEIKLSASILSFIFIIFGLMFMIPGYPILCGAFFVTLGIFKSFENYNETNDIVFSALLPISKKDIVKGKYYFVCLIEALSIILMSICVVIRNNVFLNSLVYRNNFMMNANMFSLACALIIFSLFNLIFVSGFFKTTYKKTKPFVLYMIASFMVMGLAETLIHFPKLSFLNAFGNDYINIQLILFLIGIILCLLITYIAYRKSCTSFEKIDI